MAPPSEYPGTVTFSGGGIPGPRPLPCAYTALMLAARATAVMNKREICIPVFFSWNQAFALMVFQFLTMFSAVRQASA